MTAATPTRASTNLRRAAIVTALGLEFNAIREHLTDVVPAVHKGTHYDIGHFQAGDVAWHVGIVETGAGGNRAAQETERAIDYFDPSVVLFVGVAGGFKDDVKHGDVVVGTRVHEYASGKAGPAFQTRPITHAASYALEQLARRVSREDAWLRRVKNPVSDVQPRVHIGAIAGGEVLLRSKESEIGRLLQTHYNDTLAVEMESHGFYWSAHANRAVQALVVRGISDCIEDKRPEGDAYWQPLAARHASAFAFELLAWPEELAPRRRVTASSTSGHTIEDVDKRALRDAMVASFNLEELEALCVDVQHELAADGTSLLVNLEMVGGVGKAGKVLNLIDYLDRRGHLRHLVYAVRQARPGVI